MKLMCLKICAATCLIVTAGLVTEGFGKPKREANERGQRTIPITRVGPASAQTPQQSAPQVPTLDLAPAKVTVDPALSRNDMPPKDVSFVALKKEFDEAFEKFREECRREAANAEKAAAERQKAAEKVLKEAENSERKAATRTMATPAIRTIGMGDGPGAEFSARFLRFAEENPKDPSAVESFVMALRTSGGPNSKSGIWRRVVDALKSDFLNSPEIEKALQVLAMPADEAANDLIRQIISHNPNRKIQAKACKALATWLADAAQRGELFEGNTALRGNVEAAMGKEFVEKLMANADENKKEAAQLANRVRVEYSDVLPDLSIGQPVPEVISNDVSGQKVKLSDLRGKVVVLDIWTTWCGPCRAMVPHEREMVNRLKDEPFVLVSISADEEKEALTECLAEENMPWTHWWNGDTGGIVEDWDIHGFPAIYVLDSKGVIRYKDLRGQELEGAVHELLKELDSKKPN